MRGAVIHASRDVRVEERPDPKITFTTDAIIRTVAACAAARPGAVFDLTLPLEAADEGYRAMDERRAIKTLLRP